MKSLLTVMLALALTSGSTDSVYPIYDDPVWDQLFTHLYSRTDENGNRYGPATLDPPLWLNSRYLLEGESYERAIDYLDLTLGTDARHMNPLQQALLQRDLWAIFDWVTLRANDPSVNQDKVHNLQSRLAQAIKRLALSASQIETLPENYIDAIRSHKFPSEFVSSNPETAYLTQGLLSSDERWLNITREDGPTAVTHTETHNFDGRSILHVFLHIPPDARSTRSFFNQLYEPGSSGQPLFPDGTQLALVRQMLHINEQGEIVPTPITESVQLRYFEWGTGQHFYQFTLNRAALFAGDAGGLQPVLPDETVFPIFGKPGDDPFEHTVETHPVATLEFCTACHHGTDASTFLSYSRRNFALSNEQSPLLYVTDADNEIQATIQWKQQQENWHILQQHWHSDPSMLQ